jgi:hypothetical protein
MKLHPYFTHLGLEYSRPCVITSIGLDQAIALKLSVHTQKQMNRLNHSIVLRSYNRKLQKSTLKHRFKGPHASN